MAANCLRSALGPSEKHLRRTSLGSDQHRLPVLYLLLFHNGLPSIWSRILRGLCNPWRSHDLVLGQRAVEYGIPVQLGQTGWTVRDLYQLARLDLSNPSWNVARRNTWDRSVSGAGCFAGLGDLPPGRQPGLARGHLGLCSNSSIPLCDGNGTILALPSVRTRSRLGERGAPRTSVSDFRRVLSFDGRIFTLSPRGPGRRFADSSHAGHGRVEADPLLRPGIRRTNN